MKEKIIFSLHMGIYSSSTYFWPIC